VAKEIKRSMAVYPSPIVMESDGSARHPTAREHEARRLKGGWTGEQGYTITRVTNSVEYDPGEALTKMHVQKLIDDNWTVTVLIGEGT
jgi:very-short-patch-repair endonuclease